MPKACGRFTGTSAAAVVDADGQTAGALPLGYSPVPDPPFPTLAAAETGGYAIIPDLNMAIKVEDVEVEGEGSSTMAPPPPSPATPPPAPPLPPTPLPEAIAMEQHRATLRGAWSLDALGLTSAPGASSSGGGHGAARGPPRLL
ncbi:hypothetical protein ACQJBY_006711 [Aegilops geniculata]